MRGFWQRGKFAAVRDQGVGGKHAGTAGVGEDSQPRAAGAGLFAEHFGHVKQVGDAVDAQDAAAAEGGVETSSLPVSAPVWEAAAFAAASVRPALMTMIGLVRATSRAADRNERASPIDSMYIRMLWVCAIVAEVVDEIAPADVEHRAGGHDCAEADVFAVAPIEDGGEQGAALAEEGYAAGAGISRRWRSARDGFMTPRQFGPMRRIAPAEFGLHRALERDAFGADLLEAGGDDDDGFDTRGDALSDEGGHGGSRSDDDR